MPWPCFDTVRVFSRTSSLTSTSFLSTFSGVKNPIEIPQENIHERELSFDIMEHDKMWHWHWDKTLSVTMYNSIGWNWYDIAPFHWNHDMIRALHSVNHFVRLHYKMLIKDALPHVKSTNKSVCNLKFSEQWSEYYVPFQLWVLWNVGMKVSSCYPAYNRTKNGMFIQASSRMWFYHWIFSLFWWLSYISMANSTMYIEPHWLPLNSIPLLQSKMKVIVSFKC